MLAPTADLVVGQLGHAVGERRDLRVLVDLALPPDRGDLAQLPAAVDDRQGAPDLSGQRGGVGLVGTHRIPASLQRNDRRGDLVRDPRRQAHPLECDERGDRHGTDRRPRHRDRRVDGQQVRPPLPGQTLELPTRRHDDHAGPGLGCGGRGRDRLLGVAGERAGEHERVGPDEPRAFVVLGHDDRHPGGRTGNGRGDVATDPAAAHAEDHHRADRRRPGAGRAQRPTAAAAATCSGRPRVVSSIPRVSSIRRLRPRRSARSRRSRPWRADGCARPRRRSRLRRST